MKNYNGNGKHLKELVCAVDFYLTMREGETEIQAVERLNQLLQVYNTSDNAFDIIEHHTEQVY